MESKQFYASMDSLKKFWFFSNRERGLIKVNIEAYKKRPKKLFFHCSQVPIRIVIESHNVYMDVLWEDAEYPDYKRLGLLGRYSSSNSKIKFKEEEDKAVLEVSSPEGSKALRIYLEK